MFCRECGVEVAEGVKFCPSCGKSVGGSAVNSETVAGTTSTGMSGLSNKVKIVIAAVVVVIAVVIAAVTLRGNKPEEAAVGLVNCLYTANMEALMDSIPDELMTAVQKMNGLTEAELAEEVFSEFSQIQEEVNEGLQCNAEALSTTKLVSDDLRTVQETYNLVGIKVTDAAKVSVSIVLAQDGDTESDVIEIPVVKIGRKWYVDWVNLDGSF